MSVKSLSLAALAVLVTAALACGDPGSGGGDGDGGGGDGDGGGGGGDGDAGDRADANAGAGNDTCQKIDLVISVDASDSMSEELEAIADDVFPLLAQRLLEVGEDLEDFRVGVIDACPNPATFHTRGQSTGECDFDSGEVWMDSDSSDLVAEFSCVADIFTDDAACSDPLDSDEQPASAAAQSLEPPFINNENAGFLRDDALLVVMAITDEDETECDVLNDPDCEQEPASAQEIFNRLRAIKSVPENIVFYGIGGEPPDGCRNPGGEYGNADPATKLRAITDLFIAEERGVWKDLCEGSLEDGLDEVIAVIDSACDDIIIE